MARYTAGVRTSAGSTTLPIISLYAAAAVGCRIFEIGCFNTTTTAAAIMLTRMTTTGTLGAGLTEAPWDTNTAAAACTAFTTHTVAPTLGADLGYRAPLGAAIGAGVIWTFGGNGLAILPGITNGIGILVATGTGQVCDAYISFEE